MTKALPHTMDSVKPQSEIAIQLKAINADYDYNTGVATIIIPAMPTDYSELIDFLHGYLGAQLQDSSLIAQVIDSTIDQIHRASLMQYLTNNLVELKL